MLAALSDNERASRSLELASKSISTFISARQAPITQMLCFPIVLHLPISTPTRKRILHLSILPRYAESGGSVVENNHPPTNSSILLSSTGKTRLLQTSCKVVLIFVSAPLSNSGLKRLFRNRNVTASTGNPSKFSLFLHYQSTIIDRRPENRAKTQC